MKKAISVILVLVILNCLFITTPANATTVTDISLNTRYNGTISSAGEVDYFTFTPSKTGYYTIETFGTLDTKLTFRQYDWSTLTSDDEGPGLNAMLGFLVTNTSRECTFEVTAYGSSTGNYQFQVRRQKMEIYVGDYGDDDIDTTADANTPATEMTSEGFNVSKRVNRSSADALANDSSGVPRINTEVFFFSGHGNSSTIFFYDDTTIALANVPDVYRTKVAVLAGCETGQGTNSIAQRFVQNGAIVSVGWTTTTTVSSSKTFTDAFFKEMDDARTVEEACSTASSKLLWPWDGAKNYVIFGDSDYIFLSQVSRATASNLVNCNLSETESIEKIINSNSYISDSRSGYTRYYKTIDGILTNDFYDVYDNGTVIKSCNEINYEQAKHLGDLFIESKFKLNLDEGSKNKSIKKYRIIYKQDSEIIPIEINEITTLHEDGYKYVDYICINMLNGEEINYEDISIAK